MSSLTSMMPLITGERENITELLVVQFQHPSVMTFLYLGNYAWVPSTLRHDDLSALKHLCIDPSGYILGSIQIFRHNHLSAL